MTDKKQVMFDIECCICHVPYTCKDCSKYKEDEPLVLCMGDLLKDALELLKEQETVEPQLSMSGLWYECPICHRHLTKNSDNYCARCGRSVKWK